MRKLLLLFACLGIALAGLGGSYIVPLDNDAIRYTACAVDDAVSRLQARIDKGEVKLKFEDEYGYLRSVLKELGVPVSSQVLVFSKTSFQAPRIGPRMPRALYFNDDMAVGFVRTGDVLELAALDPRQGIIFYTLDQSPASHPQFVRRDTCLQCHQSGSTLGIPGLLVRSVTPDHTGMPVMSAGGFVTDHTSPLKERWGGWYVSGTSGNQHHMGNAIERDVSDNEVREPVSQGTSNLTDLASFFDTHAYLTPHSDIVALMTLEHQTRMDNLMIRVGWEARMAMAENSGINKALGEPEEQVSASTQHRIDSAVEEMLEYMLFADETKLTSPIKGTSGFEEEFQNRGPRDSKGRSLRDFDLTDRMFRYPCSFMIYSRAFEGMPSIVKDRLYQRMFQVLTGKDMSAKFAGLTPESRLAILEIVAETKKGLPAFWTAAANRERSAVDGQNDNHAATRSMPKLVTR
jgi:hypothetical protein